MWIGVPDSFLSLNSQAYHIILKHIIVADFRPGQRLSEKELMDKLQMGRTPVREALLRLRQEGLISVVPQSGTYVAKIDIKVANSARFIRESIETRIICESAQLTITPPEQAEFTYILQNQKFYKEQKQYRKFFREDDNFHKKFYQLTNHQQVWDWLQTINMQLNRFRMLSLQDEDLPWERLIRQHQQILDTVKNHDASAAQNLITEHLRIMLVEQKRLKAKFPEYFEQTN
ncbi:GntR family transcription regulator [Bombilactobacillus mellifer]|uniref:GntR family transcription regulator n=1 Tax=Bombilactobacillus mellifer TaxID=1218492 RepID=A0A0F4LQ52_9LACO|nr:GntR family transcriptional regulator [Bombilactobacillus mellifer]KJY60730.1 GntR family transcription regulator [Bombilactobacillus mellifer]MCT6826321.1 GntR family transcriptional regulator [Bombilactobacillus mellifer]MCT6843661.1 GntR family transcriptional regulator [Bombilactobacillus mellifer]MCT6894031.1 GntR family transcriptional regulator [Bombilactobacillus mellifer]